MKWTPQQIDEAVTRGLEASYKPKTSGYLHSNSEEKMRVGILAAIQYLEEENDRTPCALPSNRVDSSS